MLRGICSVYRSLQVKRGGGGPQCHFGYVFLDAGLEQVYFTGGSPRTDYHHPGRQGIQRTGMTYFQFPDAGMAYPGKQCATQFLDHVER